MRKISKIAMALVVGLAVSGCGDDKKKRNDETLRHLNTAKAYQQQGQFRAAMIEARNAQALSPDNSDTYFMLADVYNDIGAFSASQQLLEKVSSPSSQLRLLLIEAYLGNKKFTSALHALESLNVASESEAIKTRYAELLAEAKIYARDQEGAQKALASLQALAPDNHELLFLRASALALNGQYAEAKTQLESLVAKDEKHIKAWILLGDLAAFERNLARAEEDYSKALILLPNTDILTAQKTQVLSQLTEVLTQLGRMSEAYKYQKLLAEANPESSAAQQKYNQALDLYRQGKYTEAQNILSELRGQFPQDKNTATLLGMVAFQQGSPQLAVQLFDEFVDPETAAPSVLQAAAVAKYRSNQSDDALQLLKKAAEGQPNNAGVLATYGLALLDQDAKSSEGAIVLEKSLAVDDNQQRLRLVLARHYQLLDQPQQALAQLQKSFSKQPTDLIIQQAYFKILLDAKLDEQLKTEIAKLQTQTPDTGRGWFWQGWYELQHQEYANAEKQFLKALQSSANQEKHLAYSGLGQLYETQKNYEKAIAHWKLALQADPALTPAYSHLVKLAQTPQQSADVVTFLQSLAGQSKNWQPQVVLAQVYLAKRDIANAIKSAEQALVVNADAPGIKPFAAYLYQLQAGELKAANKVAEAKISLLRALKLTPDNADYLAILVDWELQASNIGEAQKLLDQLAKTDANQAAIAYMQGLIRQAENKPEEALKLFRLSWTQRPNDRTAEAILNYYRQQGQQDAARVFVDDWLVKQPENLRALTVKAVAEQQSNHLTEAAALYEKVLAIAPNSLMALNNLAWLYQQQGDRRALDLAKRGYTLAPNAPEVLDTYGWLLAEAGDIGQALPLLEKAQAAAPDNAEIAEHLKAVKQRKK